MFPAPTTIPVSTPLAWTSTISSATASIVSRSMPYSRSPISDSPDSLSRMRRKTGRALCDTTADSSDRTLTSAAQLEPLELEHLGTLVRERLADLLAGVVDPLLVDEHIGAEEALVQHPVDDLLAHLAGLGLYLVGSEEDRPLALDILVGNVVAADPPRIHGRDVHRHLPHQVVGPAAHLQEHADLVSRRMCVGADECAVDGLEPGGARDDDVL